MVKITHYEVYTDRGDGWKLEDRFSSDQRYEAIKIAKEKELEKISVKILKEDFDVQDNSYVESVEYISGLSNKKEKSGTLDFSKGVEPKIDYTIETQGNPETPAGQSVMGAIFKLVVIIVFCLVSANILITLLIPVIEIIAPQYLTQTLLFIVFFALFILLAVPLVLKKVPWYVFNSTKVLHKKIITEKKFFDKAGAIIRNYNLNDNFDPSMVPSFPEATDEQKRDIVSFLSQIISHLDSDVSLSDNFSRLGVKLVIYGGVLELCRYNDLSITHANSLLHEAYGIIDGDMADVCAFYEAKKTYRDNKVAIFLTGVGAYLMAQLLNDRPLDTHILKATFSKWEALNDYHATDNKNLHESGTLDDDIVLKCVVNIQNSVRFYEHDQANERDEFTKVKTEMHNIISNLIGKFSGKNVVEDNYNTSIEFNKLNNAIKFAVEFYKDVSIYEDEINNSNLIIDNKCSILSLNSVNDSNLSSYIKDVFEHVYDQEIVISEEIKSKLKDDKYSFDFLGDKNLKTIGKTEGLYKLMY